MNQNPVVRAHKAAVAADAAQVFLATVAATSGNRIKITRPGQTLPDATFYAAAAGLAAAVVAGDIVMVFAAGASFTVGFKVVS